MNLVLQASWMVYVLGNIRRIEKPQIKTFPDLGEEDATEAEDDIEPEDDIEGNASVADSDTVASDTVADSDTTLDLVSSLSCG